MYTPLSKSLEINSTIPPILSNPGINSKAPEDSNLFS